LTRLGFPNKNFFKIKINHLVKDKFPEKEDKKNTFRLQNEAKTKLNTIFLLKICMYEILVEQLAFAFLNFSFLYNKKTETLDPPDRKPWPHIFLHKLLQAQAQLGLKVHVVVHALKLIHRVSKNKN
jgi:hypothetical protein